MLRSVGVAQPDHKARMFMWAAFFKPLSYHHALCSDLFL